MNCYAAGIIGIAMLCATFSTMSVTQEQEQLLRKVFTPAITDIYNKIVIERRNLYFQGLVLGLIVSYFLTHLFSTINTFHRITFTLAITGTVSVLYYIIMPKSDYMLNHLKTPEEITAWFKVYQTMKTRYSLGFVFGLFASIPIAYSFCSVVPAPAQMNLVVV